MTTTAKDLFRSLIKLIEEEGENCPVYYQLFTYKDVIDYENMLGGDLTKNIANKVIQSLSDHDSICENIFSLIDNEIQELQS
jgi:hypothetical protein